MEPHERRNLLEKPLLVREPSEKRQRGLHAALVVSERADALLHRIVRRARGLAEVVAEDGEPDEKVFRVVANARRGKGVETAERVVPHVPFWMPLRRLGASDEALELGIVLHPSDVTQEVEPLRDFDALQDQLRPFAEEPLWWKPLGSHGAADFDSLRRGVEIEARDGRKIADIFAQDGETAFRAMEKAALRSASDMTAGFSPKNPRTGPRKSCAVMGSAHI